MVVHPAVEEHFETRFGYVGILGAAHALWFPLAVYLAVTLPVATTASGIYLRVVLAVIAVSLVLDVRDVARWIRASGESGKRDD